MKCPECGKEMESVNEIFRGVLIKMFAECIIAADEHAHVSYYEHSDVNYEKCHGGHFGNSKITLVPFTGNLGQNRNGDTGMNDKEKLKKVRTLLDQLEKQVSDARRILRGEL